MRKKLLIVHPQTRYDTMHLTRAAIIAHLEQYAHDDVFVLINRKEAFGYLRRTDLVQHANSSLGEMPIAFTRQILAECTALTIVGHTGALCHHTAFESVLKAFIASDAPQLSIVLPAEAISRPKADTGESMQYYIDCLSERNVTPGWIPYRLCEHRAHLNAHFSRRETATLYVFEEYVASAFLLCHAHAAVRICLGAKLLGSTSGHARSVHVTIQ